MLKVYAWKMCPHCRAAVAWLNQHNVPFEYREIEEQPTQMLRKIIEVNGGDDWVVPTLEYNGKWRPGKVFDPAGFEEDLKNLGVPLKTA